MTITPLGRDRYLVVGDDGRQQLAHAVADGSRTWVWLDARVYVVEDAAAGPRAPVRPLQDESALSAPMPAQVASIRVAPGDRVARGDVLVTLEAMKMELPVSAPRDGTVASIACRVGDLVQPGVPLLVLE